jgi:hypothetical protein
VGTRRPGRPGQSGRPRRTGQPGNRSSLWVVGAMLLAVLSVAVFLDGLSGDDGEKDSRAGQDSEQDVASSSAPTAEEEAENIRTELAGIAEDIGSEFDATVGVSMRAGGGLVHAGDLQEIPGLSSIKVPIAMAAVQNAESSGDPVEDLIPDIDAAITESDNDAALRLWQSLGDEDEAAGALGSVMAEAGDSTDTFADKEREDYEGFGDITWTMDNQATFANRMACVNGAEPVLDAMSRLIEEHSGGLGQLQDAHIKGGWGTTADGDFVLREFGLMGPADAQVPLSIAVIPDDGTEETSREAVAEMASRIEPLVEESSSGDGTAECQAAAADTAAPEEPAAPAEEPAAPAA